MAAESDRTKLMIKILEASTKGLTKQEMLDTSGLSHQQLRGITAELADKEYLRYNESDDSYITTDKGYVFLKDVQDRATKEKPVL